ncbi:MAG: hypothetical protein Q8P67_19860, partial [archaeon]|nr:hypothetical protein [archaeon]
TKARAAPTRAAGQSRRPPTRRAKLAIETKQSTEPSSPSEGAGDSASGPVVRKNMGGPAIISFDPNAVKLRARDPAPRSPAAAVSATPLPFTQVQLRKATPVTPREVCFFFQVKRVPSIF